MKSIHSLNAKVRAAEVNYLTVMIPVNGKNKHQKRKVRDIQGFKEIKREHPDAFIYNPNADKIKVIAKPKYNNG